MLIELPFETPSKKNSRIVNRRTGRSFPSKVYSEWLVKARNHIALTCKDIERFSGPVSMTFRFYHGTMQKRDSDNQVSSILDLLVDMGIIEDDKWQIVMDFNVCNFYAKGNPSCTVEIERLQL